MLNSVVWLKDDFRTINNPAISSLIDEKKGTKKIIYIYDKDKYHKQEAQRWWLAKSLEVFQEKLKELNITLDIISGNAEKIIKNLVINKKIDKIYWNKSCHLDENRTELSVKKILEENNIIFREFSSNLLNPVERVKKDDGTPFKVFTHYWKKAEKIYQEKNQKIDERISSYSKKKKN
jgi:deoxyribodipyrimidine photo-lyase